MKHKTIIIGLVAIAVVGGALYLHNKKKGKVSSADGDDEDSSNFQSLQKGDQFCSGGRRYEWNGSAGVAVLSTTGSPVACATKSFRPAYNSQS
jgi:hypothetical protein